MKVLCIDGQNRGRHIRFNNNGIVDVPVIENIPFYTDLNKEPEDLILKYETYHIKEVRYGTNLFPNRYYLATTNPRLTAMEMVIKMEHLISELMLDKHRQEWP